MTLKTTLTVALQAEYTNPLDLVTGKAQFDFVRKIQLAHGNGAGQADRLWSDMRSLGASATENLDLAGSLVDVFGQTLTLARVKGLIVYAPPTNVNNVVVGGDVTNTFLTWVGAEDDSLIVRPGGIEVLFAPDGTAYAVTAATGDLLKVANSGGGTGVSYDIVIVGSTA